MGVRPSHVFVGGLIAVSSPAWAESLINGEPLQYNYAYRCNGERIIVARCRDSDDSSFCQMVYPDRPYVNGMQVAPVEQRGDVVAKLDACTRKATSVASSGSSSSSPTAMKARSPTSASGSTPPGLGKASWAMLDMDEDYATYFIAARISRAGGIGSGWFTQVYPAPKDFPGTSIKGVWYNQSHYQADCTKRLLKMTDVAVYDENGKLLESGPMPNPTWDPVEPDTTGQRKFNILCAKPQPLVVKKSVIGDYNELMANYLKLFEKVLEKNGQ